MLSLEDSNQAARSLLGNLYDRECKSSLKAADDEVDDLLRLTASRALSYELLEEGLLPEDSMVARGALIGYLLDRSRQRKDRKPVELSKYPKMQELDRALASRDPVLLTQIQVRIATEALLDIEAKRRLPKDEESLNDLTGMQGVFRTLELKHIKSIERAQYGLIVSQLGWLCRRHLRSEGNHPSLLNNEVYKRERTRLEKLASEQQL